MYQGGKYKINAKNLKFGGKNYKNKKIQDSKEEEEEFTPKHYRNNPLVRKGNFPIKKMKMGTVENPLKSVAQKICNILIKGDENKKIKNKNDNNRGRVVDEKAKDPYISFNKKRNSIFFNRKKFTKIKKMFK